jgi:hypothetical protein
LSVSPAGKKRKEYRRKAGAPPRTALKNISVAVPAAKFCLRFFVCEVRATLRAKCCEALFVKTERRGDCFGVFLPRALA